MWLNDDDESFPFVPLFIQDPFVNKMMFTYAIDGRVFAKTSLYKAFEEGQGIALFILINRLLK